MGSRYLIVATHFSPDFHMGGLAESASKLFKYLSRMGDVRVVAVSKNPERVEETMAGRGRCFRLTALHERWGISLAAIPGLFSEIRRSDVVYISGVFAFPLVLAKIYAIILGKPFVVASRGMLEPRRMRQKWVRKYIFTRLVLFPVIRRSRWIHVTSDREAREIGDFGFKRVVNVSNGIDLEIYGKIPERKPFKGIGDDEFVFLFLSRTDREKGLDILLEAYRKLRAEQPHLKSRLVLAGPDQQGYLKSFRLDYDAEHILRLEGVYGEDKMTLLRRADVLVLPSYSENFGNVIVEALACARPVITTTATPWSAINQVGCGYCIEPDAESLFQALEKLLLTQKNELDSMGLAGREYVLANFSWEAKAKMLFSHLEKIGTATKDRRNL